MEVLGKDGIWLYKIDGNWSQFGAIYTSQLSEVTPAKVRAFWAKTGRRKNTATSKCVPMEGDKQKGSTIALVTGCLKKVSDRKFQTTAGNHKRNLVMKRWHTLHLFFTYCNIFLQKRKKIRFEKKFRTTTYDFILILFTLHDLTMEPIWILLFYGELCWHLM